MKRIMAEAAAARGRALVLLDEVGSGTDPTEGSAIGMAVLRFLASDAALTMATTHHGRLKTLKYADDRFENACVEFDAERMAPTYRLLWGIPGRSNAIAIAERLGLQPEVLADARGLLGEDDVGVDEVVSALVAQQAVQRSLNDELEAQRARGELERGALERRAAELAVREEQQRNEAQRKLAAELAAARAEIAELVKRAQLPASAGSREALRQAQQASQDLARLAERSATAGGNGGGGSGVGAAAGGDAAGPGRDAVEAGDRVLVPRLGDGLVEVEQRRGNQLSVVFGGLKMKIKLAEVVRVVKGADANPRPRDRTPASMKPGKRAASAAGSGGGGGGGKERARAAVRLESNTLDIRGRRPSEIEADLGRAVDRALAIGTLWVIHGRGTGSLRAAVRDMLSSEPLVARLEDAPPNEGGDGCTVAFLR